MTASINQTQLPVVIERDINQEVATYSGVPTIRTPLNLGQERIAILKIAVIRGVSSFQESKCTQYGIGDSNSAYPVQGVNLVCPLKGRPTVSLPPSVSS